MNEKFLNYGCATMAAAALALYFGNLGYHVLLSLGTDMGDIEVRVFTTPNEEIITPSGYLYTKLKVEHYFDEGKTPDFDVTYFYFKH